VGVILRVPENNHERASLLTEDLETGFDQLRADSLALAIGHDRHGGETHTLDFSLRALDLDRSKENMADNPAIR
jgi:hypothetical protein